MLKMKESPDVMIYRETAIEIFDDFTDKKQYINSKIEKTNTELHNKVLQVELTKTIEDLRSKYHTVSFLKSTANKYGHDIFNFKNIIEIAKVGYKNISINQAIDIAKELYQELKENFYGIILISPNEGMINPFHPLIAKAIEDEKINLNENIYTLVVYTYKDDINIVKYFNKDLNYINEIIDLIATTSIESEYVKKRTNFELKMDNQGEFNIQYEEKIYNKTTNKEMPETFTFDPKYIVPIQILNVGGVPYPYYGSIYSVNGIAWNISPMYSANITRPSGKTQTIKNGSRICSKIGFGTTVRGISALSHANLTSPLNSDIVRIGWREYARDALKVGFTFYTDIEENQNPVDPGTPMAMKDFLVKNTEATRKDYLTYIKEYIKKKKEYELWKSKQIPSKEETNRAMMEIPPYDLNNIQTGETND